MTGPRHGLEAVGDTLFSPLFAKAKAAELVPEAGVSDPLAAELLDRIGYDPDRVLTSLSNVRGTVYRTRAIDDITCWFAAAHPNAQIVSAGIGLCTRHARLAARVPTGLAWIGIDTPEVIALRRTHLPDDPVRLIAASVIEPGWAADIPADRPTLVIAEGILMYLEQDGMIGFLRDARDWFGPGTEVIGDYFHPRIARTNKHPIVRATGARFRSGARNAAALADLAGGYEAIGDYRVMEHTGGGPRLAAGVFRVLSGGGRIYSVGHLRVRGSRP